MPLAGSRVLELEGDPGCESRLKEGLSNETRRTRNRVAGRFKSARREWTPPQAADRADQGRCRGVMRQANWEGVPDGKPAYHLMGWRWEGAQKNRPRGGRLAWFGLGESLTSSGPRRRVFRSTPESSPWLPGAGAEPRRPPGPPAPPAGFPRPSRQWTFA